MNFRSYQDSIKAIKFGKLLPCAIYVHSSTLDEIPSQLCQFLQKTIAILNLENSPWNIVKFSTKDFRISLLHYPSFFEDSYPPLKRSVTIDLNNYTYKTTNYSRSHNPPILHRKETFLRPNHPTVQLFKEITKEGEEAGLYENSHKIGFKNNWEKLIKQKGYDLINGRLKRKTEPINCGDQQSNNHEIERHKTAIDRNNLSSPIQSLFRHNFLDGSYSLFDYGCGKGDDLKILAQHGITASGFDPVYFPKNTLQKSDIVNLGFVLNVIENPRERTATLTNAYSLVQKLLVVSVMLGGESITVKFKKYGDGVITARNTFQKYYFQSEFREYIENSLGETAIAVGPGVFYVFKDKLEEQNFLVDRQRLKGNWQRLSYTDHPERLKIKQRALYRRNKELFERFWYKCLEFGRLPANDEFKESEVIRSLCFSHQKALTLLTTIYVRSHFDEASNNRRDDLLVSYALSLFSRRKPYIKMPKRLQRDVCHFFGKYTDAIAEATELLFSVGKPELIYKYCTEAHQQLSRGKLIDNHSYTIHKNDVELLPPPLRIYLGCATQLYGDIASVDLVKIHIRSGKVSLMRYDDFIGKPIPLLLERVKIKLREQEIDFYEYGSQYPPPPLFLKSILIPESFPNFQKQRSFDKKLQTFSWLSLTGYGIPLSEFEHKLSQANFAIKGFKLLRKK